MSRKLKYSDVERELATLYEVAVSEAATLQSVGGHDDAARRLTGIAYSIRATAKNLNIRLARYDWLHDNDKDAT